MADVFRKFRIVLVLILGLSILCTNVLAQGNSRRDDSINRRDNQAHSREDNRNNNWNKNRDNNRAGRFHYRNGHWYKRGWFGWEFAVPALVVGAFVESLPPNHSTLVVENNTYYYDDSVYYKQLPDGAYVVVQPPVNGLYRR